MNKSKLNKKLIIINAILVYLLINRFVIMPNALILSEGITASFTIILMVLSIIFFGYPKVITNENTKSFKNTTIISMIIYFATIYIFGLFVGFLTNSYSLKPLSIINNTYNIIIYAISIEIFRYVFIKAKENYNVKGYIYVITFLITLLETNLFMGDLAFSSLSSSFKFVTLVFLPIFVKNIMCSYMVSKTDYRTAILYRLIMDIYIYILPIQPDLGDFFMSITTILLPYIILICMTRIDENSVKITIDDYVADKKKLLKFSDVPYMIFTTILACVILGIGPLKIIGIETGSMTPAIRIGDGVLINKLCDRDKLKEGNVIAYINDENIVVVHRIYKINKDETFITKGDYNNSADARYVSKEQVVGKVLFKIPYIAYPAIYFKK